MRAVFADPKTDFVFKRIFGSEAHKKLLVALLDSLLELDEAHRILDLEFLTPEQHLPIEELKLSIVDVKCRDASGRTYVVEMQVLNVEGFEKRVVAELDLYDRSKIAEQDARGALALSRREGKAEGKAEGLVEGKAEGLAEGLREAIRTACLLLGVELSPEKERQLAGLGLSKLEELKEKLIQGRRWPDS